MDYYCYYQWLNSAGTAFRHLCLAFHHLKLPFHHLKLSFHHLAMTFRHHLGKIIKIIATRGQISKLKFTKYYFGWGSAPDPAGEITVYIACPEEPLEGVGLLLRGWEGGKGKWGKRIEERKGKKGRGRNVAFHHLLLSNLTTDYYQHPAKLCLCLFYVRWTQEPVHCRVLRCHGS